MLLSKFDFVLFPFIITSTLCDTEIEKKVFQKWLIIQTPGMLCKIQTSL